MAFQNWKREPEETKERWRKLTDAGGWCLSAHNLYMSLSMNPEPERLAYYCERYGIEVENPPWVPQ